ncbi:MAG: TadE family protein [Candidatus Methylacidiphilales bacterium]|nr:TadE family protein [Candidatus Methylacidiphilales bacterium]
MSTPQTRRRKSRAQTTVEFAMVAPLFFAVLFATLDYAQVFFYEHSLRYALYMSGRFAMIRKPMVVYSNGIETTNIVKDGGTNISHYRSIRWVFQSNCVMYVPEKNIVAQWYTLNDTNLKPGVGDKETFLRLTAVYKVTLITPVGRLLSTNWGNPGGTLNLMASSVFRLESADTPYMPITNPTDITP